MGTTLRDMSTTSTSPEPSQPTAGIARGMFLDIGLPLAAFYGLSALGMNDWVSLLAATVVSGLRTAWTAIRARRLNPFSTVMLAVFGVGLALAFVTADPRLMILKDSAGTAVVGLLFLVTTLAGRPLTLEAHKAWSPGEAAEIDRAWAGDPEARHVYRVTSLGWGVGLLVEAVVRVPLVFLVPVEIMVGLSTAMWIVTVVLLIGWQRWYIARVQRREAAAGVAPV
jgi:hypothetical protein